MEPEDGQWLTAEDGMVYTVEYAAYLDAVMTLSEESAPQENIPEGVLATQSRTVEALSFDEKFVAHIGTVGYESFPAAMKAVKEGETVVLLKDVDSDGMYMASSKGSLASGAVQIANNVTVDLNGHTIKASDKATTSDNQRNGVFYGVFSVKDKDYILNIAGIGMIDGRVVCDTSGTLNINGSVDITGQHDNHTIVSNGDININAPIEKLVITENMGNVTVNENASAANLTVNMPAPTSKSIWVRSLTVNGPVTNLTVDQKTAHSTYNDRVTQSVLTVNAPVETLKLTQGQAGGSFRADLWNKAYINASVGMMTATQAGKVCELYLDSTVDTLDLVLFNKNFSDPTNSDVPITQAGPNFQAGQINFARLNLLNFASPNVRDNYANPMTPVEDVVLITGINGHTITAD